MKVTIEGTAKEIAAFLFMAEKRPDKRMTDKAHGDVLSAMVEYSAGAISSEEYRDRLAAVLKQDCSWQSCQTMCICSWKCIRNLEYTKQ